MSVQLSAVNTKIMEPDLCFIIVIAEIRTINMIRVTKRYVDGAISGFSVKAKYVVEAGRKIGLIFFPHIGNGVCTGRKTCIKRLLVVVIAGEGEQHVEVGDHMRCKEDLFDALFFTIVRDGGAQPGLRLFFFTGD